MVEAIVLWNEPNNLLQWNFHPEPVPMFSLPGSPLHVQTFGSSPDDHGWERAHEYYLREFGHRGYSDIQDQKPKPLAELECVS